MPANQCPACDSPPAPEPMLAREMMAGLKEQFEYKRCSECASLWISEIPPDLAKYYGSAYYSFGSNSPHVGPLPKLRRAMLGNLPFSIARTLYARGQRGLPSFWWLAGLRLDPDAMIGDIGSGSGGLLEAMRLSGFTNLWGFDPYIRDSDRHGIHLRRAEPSDVPTGFKVLMLHHSLEHMADPVAVLSTLRTRLSASGRLVVRIPIANSFADRHYGPNWVALDPPRHLVVPSATGFARIAARSGFLIEQTFFDSYALQIWGSEQYQRDIPLRSPGSVAEGDRTLFSNSDLLALESLSKSLNELNEGDQAGFILKPLPE